MSLGYGPSSCMPCLFFCEEGCIGRLPGFYRDLIACTLIYHWDNRVVPPVLSPEQVLN
jgi:hypothetical protein